MSDAHRPSEKMLCHQLREIAANRPMSAMTRTKLRQLALQVELVERDRDSLLAIVGKSVKQAAEGIMRKRQAE